MIIVTMRACQQASGSTEIDHMPQHYIEQDRLYRVEKELKPHTHDY